MDDNKWIVQLEQGVTPKGGPCSRYYDAAAVTRGY
jgi:hypothetical protein